MTKSNPESVSVLDVNTTSLPRHIAIIMDGNGRWARERGLPRLDGHRAGATAVRTVVEECRRLGIRYLTLFSFSTENWNRSVDEVQGLMKLFQIYLEQELQGLLENGIRLRAIGDLNRLPADVQRSLQKVMDLTAHNTGLDLILALSYGGREEIIAATRQIAEDLSAGRITSAEIDHKLFESRLWSHGIPDPDLLIRTSNELRISNFYLWQMAYAEIVVTSDYWPDFNAESLQRCLEEFKRRERRFGLTAEQIRALTNGDKEKAVSDDRVASSNGASHNLVPRNSISPGTPKS